MKNYIRIIFSSLLLIWATPSNAEFNFGVGLIAGQVDSDGTETEGTAADTSDRTATFEEAFAGADVFAEFVTDGGYALGVTYIPIDKDVGKGTRVDVNGNDAAENDDGTRTAEATLEDMYSIYANIPLFGNVYGLLAYNEVDVITKETLNESSYGNKSIDGYSYGLGYKGGAMKYEVYYTDFDDFTLTATGGGTNSVAADIDALTFRLSYGF